MPWPLGHTVWSFSTKPAGTPRVSSRFRKTSPCCRCRPHVRSSMQQRTSGNTCARPISPTVYSRATPTFLMPVRPPGASFSTKPAASPPSQRATGQSSVNHNEGWYNGRLGDLERAISQLRETRGIDQPREMTIAHLIEAVEAAGRAIKEERWAREGYSEFLGE